MAWLIGTTAVGVSACGNDSSEPAGIAGGGGSPATGGSAGTGGSAYIDDVEIFTDANVGTPATGSMANGTVSAMP